MKPSLKFKWLIPMLLLVVGGLAVAQEQYADPPSRVARLQFIEGQVSLQPGGVDDWIFAGLNRPLTTADRLWADRDSRAELSIGTAALRLGGETSMTFTNLSDSAAQVELDQGTLSVFVRYLNEGELVEIDTPNIAFTVNEPGEYRIDVNPDEDRTWVQVRRGSGGASGQAASVELGRGQLYEFSNGDSGEYTVADASPRDDFEAWCFQRERRQIASPSLRYLPPGTVGYEALDDAGDWQPTPVYGTVWYPRVNAGWAPYRDGHWAWVEPWGWTWVDDEPWGFAPFHYGRWAFITGRWGWIPGPREVRPVYAPALVAWIGGPSFGVAIGIGGGVGWVPLGWHDPYIPHYNVSPEYARRVNISNSRVVNTTIINNYYSTTNVNVRNTQITNIHYENVRVQNAVTVVPSNALASGRPVRQVAMNVPPQAMARATFAPAPAVVPTRQAVLGPRQASPPPARLAIPKQVVAKTPPPPPPVSFDRQRPLLEKSGGMPLAPAQRATLRSTTPPPAAHERPPVVTVAPTTRQAPPAANRGPATPPTLRGAPNARTTPTTPGATPPAPAPGRPAERPATPFGAAPNRPAPAEGREAITPGSRPAPAPPSAARPATPATPATPAAPSASREFPGARPATPATPATPASPAEGRDMNRPAFGGRPTTPPEGRDMNRPGPAARPPATPPEGREMNRPGPPARPATPPEERTMERPTPPSRPTPPERTMERPAPPSRPAPEERMMERPTAPSRPTAPERTMERPAPPSRPAPAERTMERPAPPSRPAPPERTMERPAPQPSRPAPPERTMERPASRPPASAPPEQQRKTPPPKDNTKDKDNKDKNPEQR